MRNDPKFYTQCCSSGLLANPAIEPLLIRVRPKTMQTGEGMRSAKVSIIELGLWLLSLALVLRLTVFTRQRSLNDFSIVDSYALVQISIVFGCLCFSLLSGRIRRIWRMYARSVSGIVIFYYLLGAVSAAWSEQPGFSLYRAIEVISQIVTIHLALSYASGFAVAERRVLLAIAISAVFGVVSVVTALGFRSDLAWWHTNQYTVPGMLVFVYGFGELLAGRSSNRHWLVLAAGCGLLLLLLGTSSASFIAAFCGVLVALMFSHSRSRHLLIFSVAGCMALLVIGMPAIEKTIFYGKSQQNIEQLNGRKYMWSGYLDEFANRPLLGHGFAISARISQHFRSTNTHNSALSVVLGTGLLGLGIVAFAMKRLLHDGLRAIRRRRPGSVGTMAAIVAGLANSMSVAFLGEGWMMSSFSFVCLLALFTLFVAGDAKPAATPATRVVIRTRAGWGG